MYDGRSGSRNTTDRAKAGSCKREQSHSIQYPTVLPYAKPSIRRSAAAMMDVSGLPFYLTRICLRYLKIHPSQRVRSRYVLYLSLQNCHK